MDNTFNVGQTVNRKSRFGEDLGQVEITGLGQVGDTPYVAFTSSTRGTPKFRPAENFSAIPASADVEALDAADADS